MAVLCSDYRLLFIGNPRTGSTAIGQALVAQAGGQFFPSCRVMIGDEQVSKRHSTVDQLVRHSLLSVDIAPLYKFVAVRNPFDSLITQYVKNRYRENRARTAVQRLGLEFRDFVLRQFQNRTPRSMHAEFVAGTDEVIRFETLQEGLSAVLAKVSGPDVQIPVVNRTEQKKRHYSEYYDDETRGIVAAIFAEDLERFGYSFEDRRAEAEDSQDAVGLAR